MLRGIDGNPASCEYPHSMPTQVFDLLPEYQSLGHEIIDEVLDFLGERGCNRYTRLPDYEPFTVEKNLA